MNYHQAKLPPGEFPPIKFPNPNPDPGGNSPGGNLPGERIWPGGNSPGGNIPGGGDLIGRELTRGGGFSGHLNGNWEHQPLMG